ncbi:MAG: hypothetical protein M1336_06025 [Deltaproteobacteria bacterium]|nr:hypothetical protein [Deltaproteobacteria bacterium]
MQAACGRESLLLVTPIAMKSCRFHAWLLLLFGFVVLTHAGVAEADDPAPEGSTGLLGSSLAKAGDRIFIEPLVAKDPDIDNQVTAVPQYVSGYHRSSSFELPFTIEKRLTPSFSLQVGTQYEQLFAPGLAPGGLEYGEVQGKYLFYVNAPHEIMASFIVRVLALTGMHDVGQGPPAQVNSYLLFSKGFGDLPVWWLRPLAVQADVAGLVPIGQGQEPLAPFLGLANFGDMLRFDVAVEYSLLYLNDVVGLRMPVILNQVTPAVEVRTLTNLSANGYYGQSAGYASYEVNYQASWYQVSVAYQRSFGPDAPFRGASWLVYVTYFYDDLLERLGFNPTPW